MMHATVTRPSRPPDSSASARSAIIPGAWQSVFAALACFVYLGVHFGLNRVSDEIQTGYDPIPTLSQAAILLVAGLLVVRYRARCLRALPGLLPFAAFLALATASTLWSQSPGASARRALSLATLLIFALYSFSALGLLRTCRIQVASMWIVAFASLIAAAVVPSSGFDYGELAGAVRGVFQQKNSLGEAMTTGLLALSYMVLHRRRVVWTDGIHLAVAIGMIVLSRSTTSLLLAAGVAAATIGLLLLSRGIVWAGLCLLGGCMLVTLILGVLIASPDSLLEALGKDATLTGRSAIWAAIGHAVAGTPLLGFGYSAFWLPDSVTVQRIWAELEWHTPSAHSGYLDTLLELGVVGLVQFAAMGVLTAILIARAFVGRRWPDAGWALIVLGIVAVFNFDESSLPRPDMHQLQWVWAVLVLLRPATLPVAKTAWTRPRVVWPVAGAPIAGRR